MESQVCEQRRAVSAPVQVYAGHLPQVSNSGTDMGGGGGGLEFRLDSLLLK